jgi:hypothetical protein
MGQITIKAYDKIIYDRTLPDKVCFAIAKDREKRDMEFAEKQKTIETMAT